MTRLFSPLFRRFILCGTALLMVQCAASRQSLGIPYKKLRHDQIARSRAEEHFIMARDFERRGLIEEAGEEYSEAYKLDPSSKTLRNIIVGRYIEAGKFDAAIAFVKGGRSNRDLGDDEKRIVAEIYLRGHDFPKAVQTFESIHDKNDNDNFYLATIYEMTGETAKSLDYYTTLCKRNDLSLEIGLKTARMQLSLNRLASADSLSVRLQRQFGDIAPVSNLRGMLSLAHGDTATALVLFNKAVAADSLNEEGLRTIALLYLKRNDYKKAISCYETLTRFPKSMQETYGRTLAILYYYDKEYQKAEALLGKLCENLVNDEEVHFYLGLVYAGQDKNDLARIELEKTIALRSDFFDAWRELVGLWVRDHDFEQAQITAERCTRQFPRFAGSWRLLGFILNLKKEYDRSITAYVKATSIDSLDASVWFDLGNSYERKKDFNNASVAFRKVLQLDPTDGAALNYLGYMWADHGIKLDSARVLVEAALKLEPYNGAFLDSYAWILFKIGSLDSAEYYLQKAIVRMTDDPVVFEHLGDILCGKKEFSGAVVAYKKSIELNNEAPEMLRRKIINLEPLLRHENQ
jgi:tetratricopeptide (TPR) repeat protein